MDNTVNKIRSSLQGYWASNPCLQQLIELEKCVEGKLEDHESTLGDIMEDLEKTGLPAGLTRKEVICLMTLFRCWIFRERQQGNSKLFSERMQEARATYPAIPFKSFAEANIASKPHASEIKGVLGLLVYESSDVNNDYFQGIGGRQGKRKFSGTQEEEDISQPKNPHNSFYRSEPSPEDLTDPEDDIALPQGTVIIKEITDM